MAVANRIASDVLIVVEVPFCDRVGSGSPTEFEAGLVGGCVDRGTCEPCSTLHVKW
jgi:hypothetical protein